MTHEGHAAVDHALAIAHGAMTKRIHTGAIHSAVPGRTDHIPMTVPSNSYVLPADVVSGLAEGNTLGGAKLLDETFKQPPFNSPTSPSYGESDARSRSAAMRAPGGAMPDHGDGGVEIVAAGGEYVVSPHQVAILGGGDMKAGHKKLDQFVRDTRAKTVKTMSKLPGPVKDPTK